MKQIIFIICMTISLVSCATTENIYRTESKSEKYMYLDNEDRVIRGVAYDEYNTYKTEDLTDEKLGHKKGAEHFLNYLFKTNLSVDYVPNDKAYEHYDKKGITKVTDIKHIDNNTVEVNSVTKANHKVGSKKIESKEKRAYEKGKKDTEKIAKGIAIFLAILDYIL